MPRHGRRSERSNRRRVIAWAVVALVIIIVGLVAWIGIRGLLAKGELEAAVPLAGQVQDQLVAGDSGAALATSIALEKHASSAASLTSDPVWRVAELIPFAGPNLTVVRELAGVVDQISGDAVGPLVSAAGGITISNFKPVDGTVQLQPLLDAAPQISVAAKAFTEAAYRASTIDASSALPQLQDAASQLRAAVNKAATVTSSVDRAVRLLPIVLGADGPRNYLVLFQNPAELRAGGGIPSAMALIHTEGGHIDLAQQASSGDFPHYPDPVLTLPDATRGIYGDIVGEYIQDVTLTPQFPQAAALAQEMWKRQFGLDVDGVISADPVMLSYLLDATGPVDVGNGEQLTSANAVQVLLSDTYARFPNPSDQDDFFAASAAAVFSRLTSGQLEPAKLITALARAGGEGRVLVWSARPEEQAVLDGTTLNGELPVSDEEVQRFGVYLNDATGAKMDYYLKTEVATGQAVCRQDGLVTMTAQITLTNTAPANAATLPEYVTGGGSFGVTPGNIRTLVHVYAPPSSTSLSVTSDRTGINIHPATDSGYPVTSYELQLAPGESKTVRVSALAAEGFSGAVKAVTTPGINTFVTENLSPIC